MIGWPFRLLFHRHYPASRTCSPLAAELAAAIKPCIPPIDDLEWAVRKDHRGIEHEICLGDVLLAGLSDIGHGTGAEWGIKRPRRQRQSGSE
jgi:hypothetical protein